MDNGARKKEVVSNGSGRAARAARSDVVIIGGGPAGVAAAVQLKRGGADPLIIERDRIGGLLREAHLVENYPGFPDGIAGGDLAELLSAHVERAGIDVSFEEVTLLEYADGAFSIYTASGVTAAETVVIASGTAPDRLRDVRISGEAEERVHYGVRSLEAVAGACIAVIGGGDAAFDYALGLSKRNDVVILHRSRRPRCIPVLRERCAAAPRIAYHADTTVEEIIAAGDGVILKCASGPGAEAEPFAADHVVVAIGRVPCLDFLDGGIREWVDGFRMEKLLYIIGDVTNGTLRQAAISAGDGVRAAMEILERRRTVVETSERRAEMDILKRRRAHARRKSAEGAEMKGAATELAVAKRESMRKTATERDEKLEAGGR